jgi:hypothetical protein
MTNHDERCCWPMGHRDKHNCSCICAMSRGHRGRHQCEIQYVLDEAAAGSATPTDDLAVLARVGRMYLDALDDDPANEMLTLPEAVAVTDVRDAVERAEAAAGSATPTGDDDD